MLKAIFFSERNLEEIVSNALACKGIDIETKDIFEHFYKFNYKTLTVLFYNLFTNLSKIFVKAITTENPTTTNKVFFIIDQFSKAIQNFYINNLYIIDFYDVVYKERDIISDKIDSLFYEFLYDFISINYNNNKINDIFEDICFIVSFVLDYMEYFIVDALDDSKCLFNDVYFVYIDENNGFLIFYIYNDDVSIK